MSQATQRRQQALRELHARSRVALPPIEYERTHVMVNGKLLRVAQEITDDHYRDALEVLWRRGQ